MRMTWGFLSHRATPVIIHLVRWIFPEINHPASLGYPPISHRIHVWYIYIYANVGGILMGSMLPYIYTIHGSYGLCLVNFPASFPRFPSFIDELKHQHVDPLVNLKAVGDVTDAQSEAASLRKLEMYPAKSGFNISFQRASVNLLDTRTFFLDTQKHGTG